MRLIYAGKSWTVRKRAMEAASPTWLATVRGRSLEAREAAERAVDAQMALAEVVDRS